MGCCDVGEHIGLGDILRFQEVGFRYRDCEFVLRTALSRRLDECVCSLRRVAVELATKMEV